MKKRLFVWLLYIPLRRIQFSTYLLIMKKSTLKRLQAQTGTEATASNLNKVMGKRDARQVVNMDTEAVGRATAAKRKAERKAQAEADREATKQAKAEAKAIDRAAEQAEQAAACWFAA